MESELHSRLPAVDQVGQQAHRNMIRPHP
jgi:hypothetical protein